MSDVYFRGTGAGARAGAEGSWDLEERWGDVAAVADLRGGDEVLDVGCAEGLVTFEVARRVRRVRAVEIEADRLETARRLAAERGIENVAWEVGSIVEMELAPRSFDVVLFLGVYHHLAPQERVPSLEKVLAGARRQVLVRTPIQNPPRVERLEEIFAAFERRGFEGWCFPVEGRKLGNLLVANRAGEGVERSGYPGISLVPARGTRP